MNIFFIIIHFLSINEVSSEKMVSKHTMKWLDAQKFCRRQGMVSKTGKFTLVEKSSESYWSRQYTKRSDWIHFLGCYEQDTVLQHVISNLTILDITAVKCHLHCLPDSKTFGIQGNNCFCFSKVDSYDQRLHISRCNSVVEKFPVGNNFIFIYRTTDFEAIRPHKLDATIQEYKLCVQIFCVKFKEVKFTMADCESFGNALCTNEDLTKVTKDMKCRSCGDVCKLECCSESRLAFCEPASEQEKVSRDETTSRDNKGLMTSDQNIYLDTSTITFDESSRMPNDTPYSSISHRNTYSSSYTQDVSTKNTQVGSSSTKSTKNGSSEITPIVYSVPIALAVIIVVVCFLYCRKKPQKRRNNNLDAESTAESKQVSAQLIANTELDEMADNSKLDTLHSDSVTLDTVHIPVPKSDGDITDDKSGVYEKVSGINVSESTDVYNHLWEKDVTTEQNDNIYDHSSTVCDTENPLYDITTNKSDHKVSPDPTYDHAVQLDNPTGEGISEVNHA